MKPLIIKQEHTISSAHAGVLVIDKEQVAALYSELDYDGLDRPKATGSAVLLMNCGKEFRFKYEFHEIASTTCLVLSQAILMESAAEITI